MGVFGGIGGIGFSSFVRNFIFCFLGWGFQVLLIIIIIVKIYNIILFVYELDFKILIIRFVSCFLFLDFCFLFLVS